MIAKNQNIVVDKINKKHPKTYIGNIGTIMSSPIKEATRPTLYRGLKYWGKKPHNIWQNIIKKNTEIGDVVYDPFAGSALTFFESIKIGRKPVIADINPITLFLVDVYSKNFDLDKIAELATKIIKKAQSTRLYKQNFTVNCSNCNRKTDIYNYRVNDAKIVAQSYRCRHCGQTITDACCLHGRQDIESFGLDKPTYRLDNLSSVTPGFIKVIGGNNITDLWTCRNLELLSFLFNEIKEIKDIEQDALMFAFLQIVHLTTKMCALRNEKTNRPLSTSWGRPAYLGLKSFMEQNPIIQFERAIFGKSGVIKCLKSRNTYLPKYTYSTNLSDLEHVDGVVLLKDSKEIFDGFKPKLVLTDPPYGSIIQYGELSQLWNVWLEMYSDKFVSHLEKEIIVNKNKSYDKYISDMTRVLANCRDLLYPDGVMILTFNSNNDNDWAALETAITKSKWFLQEKLHQRNKRSSEANVKDKTGLGITDFYLSLQRVDIAIDGVF